MRTVGLIVLMAFSAFGAEPKSLPGTQPLTWTNDLSRAMVGGIDLFLMRETAAAPTRRTNLWQRDFSSVSGYAKSVEPNRERLRRIIGAVDPRESIKALEFITDSEKPSVFVDNERFAVHAVRYPVFTGVHGEGLLVRPKNKPTARVIALPDADQTPEMILGLAPGIPEASQFAWRLAESGCEVLILALIDRRDTWSGNARLKRFTNQPHREWIYRQAYEMGRHIIGYEVQKVLAGVDYLARDGDPVGVIGYGEGGLIAFYAAAIDSRIHTVAVSGYFNSRQGLWEEPIYRNVFNLLTEFGDAEIASLIAPRTLIVEHSDPPKIDGPPAPREGRGGAAPGKITAPEFNSVDGEVRRANALMRPLKWEVQFFHGNEGMTMRFGSEPFVKAFLRSLGGNLVPRHVGALGTARPTNHKLNAADARQQRQFAELVEHTQQLLRLSEFVRKSNFWKTVDTTSLDKFQHSTAPHKTNFWREVLGRFPRPTGPFNARSRLAYENEKWVAYDVILDTHPDVFAWGVLLLPKDLQPGERRPVVVCQHGLEGLPYDTITDNPKESGYAPYKAFSARLAERGFVVFAPHNPYRGRDSFRVLQRKANPLGRSLFSIILAQHERILDWLSEQPFVDPERIGFYGLSYGGKTAMRVPSLLDRYVLSICSADFNEWILKNVTTESPYSYMFTIEYEMPEFNLGHTFNYAEMAALVAPRPFMVERGHDDGVAPDEWVAYEYAKVRRLYAKLGIADRTEIEFFNGPHTINGVGTFQFLHEHLKWPER
ncbi:MAG: prolyl oligopeptidase family serine peptidase [Verrucomicrobia subdivision 3 bacterium]|nr:prolyl oligopeptidase family serine peptidase [Limisphaerales bacterium]